MTDAYVPLTGQPTWHGAACADHPEPELWHADCNSDRNTTAWRRRMDIQTAKHICGGCQIQETCLEFAVAEGIRWGIWGGRLPEERGIKTPRRCARIDCDRRYTPRTTNQKYCSRECARVVHRRQRNASQLTRRK
jgi:Transcription factor WhiB